MYGPPMLITIDRKGTKKDIENLEIKIDKELKEYKSLLESMSTKRKPYMMNQSEGHDNVETR